MQACGAPVGVWSAELPTETPASTHRDILAQLHILVPVGIPNFFVIKRDIPKVDG